MSKLREDISIRQATEDDAVLISVLASTTFYEAYFTQDETQNLANYISESFEVDGIRAEISDPDSTFFLIFLDEKAVGYTKLISNSRLGCISHPKAIELKRIYLVERVWRTGIGKTLLEHCIDEAKFRRDLARCVGRKCAGTAILRKIWLLGGWNDHISLRRCRRHQFGAAARDLIDLVRSDTRRRLETPDFIDPYTLVANACVEVFKKIAGKILGGRIEFLVKRRQFVEVAVVEVFHDLVGGRFEIAKIDQQANVV